MRKYTDVAGQRFGRLLALRHLGEGKWLCQCDCGKQSTPSVTALKKGMTQSCGCYHQERRVKHGFYKDRQYRVWLSMRQRCENPNDRSYKNYGGRGITVCERWQEFVNFLADMGPRPKGFDIDRIDNSRGYEPGNCRWVSRRQNLLNTRLTRMLTYNGETLPMRIWADRIGVPHSTLKNRIDRGWSIEVALTAGRHVRGKRKSQSSNTGI